MRCSSEVLKWVTEDDYEEIRKRKKFSRLSPSAKRKVLEFITDYSQDYKEIKHFFRLSASTIKRLKKEAKIDSQFSFNKTPHNKERGCLSNDELVILEAIITPPKPPLTIEKITKEFNENSGENRLEYLIRKNYQI